MITRLVITVLKKYTRIINLYRVNAHALTRVNDLGYHVLPTLAIYHVLAISDNMSKNER